MFMFSSLLLGCGVILFAVLPMMSSTLKAFSSCCFGRRMTWRVMPSSAGGNAVMSSAAKATEMETNAASAIDTTVLMV